MDAISEAPLITIGTWKVDPAATGPGAFMRKFTGEPEPPAGGAAAAGGGVPMAGGGGGVGCVVPRLVCGTCVTAPPACAACFICAMAAGAAVDALVPGTVPTV